MQWTSGENAGFTSGNAWIEVNANHSYINAESEKADNDSILSYYKKLIRLRKDYDIIAYGDFEPLDVYNPSVMAYKRTWNGEELIVICNFYGKESDWKYKRDLNNFSCIAGNYPEQIRSKDSIKLRPYECMVLYGNK